MSIAVDHASLGTSANITGTTRTLTTTSAVASSGFIVLAVAWYSGTDTLSSVAGGSLTWTIDKQGIIAGDSGHIAIVSAQAPSGLASGTTITATFSGNVSDGLMGASSFTGVATTSPVDGTPTGPTTVSTAAWSTGSYTIAAGSMLTGASWKGDFSATSSTPGSGTTEALDWTDDGNGATLCYRIEPSAGSYAVTGTWNSASEAVTIGVAYKAAGGGGTDATVTAVLMDGTGDIPAPTLAAGSTVTAALQDGTGDIPNPTVSAGSNATVTAVLMDGTGDIPTPTVSGTGSSTVTAVVADGTGDIRAPSPEDAGLKTVTLGPYAAGTSFATAISGATAGDVIGLATGAFSWGTFQPPPGVTIQGSGSGTVITGKCSMVTTGSGSAGSELRNLTLRAVSGNDRVVDLKDSNCKLRFCDIDGNGVMLSTGPAVITVGGATDSPSGWQIYMCKVHGFQGTNSGSHGIYIANSGGDGEINYCWIYDFPGYGLHFNGDYGALDPAGTPVVDAHRNVIDDSHVRSGAVFSTDATTGPLGVYLRDSRISTDDSGGSGIGSIHYSAGTNYARNNVLSAASTTTGSGTLHETNDTVASTTYTNAGARDYTVPSDSNFQFTPGPFTTSTDATVTAVLMDGTGDLVTPAQVFSAEVDPGPMSGTGDIPTPAVGGTGDATVIVPPIDGTGDLVTPTVSATSTVTAVLMDGTGDIPTPTVGATGSSTVTPPFMDGTGDLVTPTFTRTARVTAVVMDGTGDLPTPSGSGGGPRGRVGEVTTGGVEVTARLTGGSEVAHSTGGGEVAHTTGGDEVFTLTGGLEVALA